MPEKRPKIPQISGDIKTVTVRLAVGALIGIVLFFALSAAASFVLWKTDTDSSIYKFVMLAAGALSSFCTGFASVRPIRKNGLALGALSSLPLFLAVFLASTLISKSSIGAVGWIMLGVQMLFAAIGGIIAVNKRK